MVRARCTLICQQAQDARCHAMQMCRHFGPDRLVAQNQAELFPAPTYLHRVRTFHDRANCQEAGDNLRRTEEERQEARQRPETRAYQ